MFAVVAVGDEKPTKEKAKVRPRPQLAGMGIISPPHMCTSSFSECLGSCSQAGGADCELECQSDCNVCALDFGEESLAVCRK